MKGPFSSLFIKSIFTLNCIFSSCYIKWLMIFLKIKQLFSFLPVNPHNYLIFLGYIVVQLLLSFLLTCACSSLWKMSSYDVKVNEEYQEVNGLEEFHCYLSYKS